MDATGLISRFGQIYTVTRYGAGAYVNGLYISGATTTFQTFLSIQPIKGTELLNLPEGQRTRRWMKGYSPVQLLTARQTPSEKSDEVPFDGKVFEVHESEKWVWVDGHWKILLVEKNPI